MYQNSNLEQFNRHCQVLGVAPGDSAEQVRRSFRLRIKQAHPDTSSRKGSKAEAQLLLEAYSAFKKGVPKLKQQDQASFYASPTAAGGTNFWGKASPVRKARTYTQEQGHKSAMRMFDAIFNDIQTSTKSFKIFFDELAGDLYPEKEHGAAVWEIPFPKRDGRGYQNSGSLGDAQLDYHKSDAMERYESAELVLKNIVFSFEHRKNRFQRNWAREFIGELLQVQVLYRDLCRFAPSLSYQALQRVRQISELISEIRNNL